MTTLIMNETTNPLVESCRAKCSELAAKLEKMITDLEEFRYDIRVNRTVDLSWYMQKSTSLTLLAERLKNSSDEHTAICKWVEKEAASIVPRLRRDSEYLSLFRQRQGKTK